MPHQRHTLTRIGDFDPAKFTIYAYCGACGHSAPLDPEKVGQEVELRTLPARLRCSARNRRKPTLILPDRTVKGKAA